MSRSLGMAARDIVVDSFCLRQFDASSGKTPYISLTVDEFEARLNELSTSIELAEGYAPFCKHLFVPNFAGCVSNVLEITPTNEHLLRSAYVARTDQELPVLHRWFPKEAVDGMPEAKFLDVILYSREQINEENIAQGNQENRDTAPWGVVSVKAQDCDYELPMAPITMMRNALGKAEGGSGVPLDVENYKISVAYWQNHANVQ